MIRTEVSGGHGAIGEPSVSAALEHLVAGGQSVIAKRIDLALLEGDELLSRKLRVAALAGLGMVLAAAAWFAVATCLVVVITPDGALAGRLAIFRLLNFAAALGLVALALRASARPGAAAGSKGN